MVSSSALRDCWTSVVSPAAPRVLVVSQICDWLTGFARVMYQMLNLSAAMRVKHNHLISAARDKRVTRSTSCGGYSPVRRKLGQYE